MPNSTNDYVEQLEHQPPFSVLSEPDNNNLFILEDGTNNRLPANDGLTHRRVVTSPQFDDDLSSKYPFNTRKLINGNYTAFITNTNLEIYANSCLANENAGEISQEFSLATLYRGLIAPIQIDF